MCISAFKSKLSNPLGSFKDNLKNPFSDLKSTVNDIKGSPSKRDKAIAALPKKKADIGTLITDSAEDATLIG